MDLFAQMEMFVRVVEAGGITAAAGQLRRSAAAVSRQLGALERELGVQLLTRNTRRVRPTEAGREYYQRCRRLLVEVDEARRVVRRDSPMDGALVVSAPVSFGLVRVCPYLPPLLARHPQLRIDLRLEDRLVDLTGDGIDLAIRVGAEPPDSASLVARPLTTYRRRLVASPGYLARCRPPGRPADLQSHELLVQGEWRLQHGGQEHRIEGEPRLRSSAPFALLEAALAGAGIALMPDWLVDAEIERGRLLPVLPEWGTEAVRVHALHRAELRGAPRVRAFVENLLSGWAEGRAATLHSCPAQAVGR